MHKFYWIQMTAVEHSPLTNCSQLLCSFKYKLSKFYYEQLATLIVIDRSIGIPYTLLYWGESTSFKFGSHTYKTV